MFASKIMKKTITTLMALLLGMLIACTKGDKSGKSDPASGGNSAKSETTDKLWTKLSGYWKCISTTAGTEDISNIFYFYGYDGAKKPICNVIWGYEGGEAEYVTEVKALDEHRFRVTLETPANHEEGLFEIHEAYSRITDYDLRRYSDKRITITSANIISEWEYAGKNLDDLQR